MAQQPYTHLSLSYANWKLAKTAITGTAYYIQDDNEYILVAVDATNGYVVRTEVYRVQPLDTAAASNLSDFEGTVKSTLTAVPNIDTAIAKKAYSI